MVAKEKSTPGLYIACLPFFQKIAKLSIGQEVEIMAEKENPIVR